MVADQPGLPELVDALRWRWKLTALIALGIFAGAVLYVSTLPPVYEGKATVALTPKDDVDTDIVRIVGPQYVAYVTAPVTVSQVAEDVDQDAGELADAVDASLVTDTGNLEITVEGDSPEETAEAANSFAQAALDFTEVGDPVRTKMLALALPNESPVAPPTRLLQAAALLVGLIVGIAVSFFVERSKPRVRSWKDLAQLTGYNVIGRIPKSRVLRRKPLEAFGDPRVGVAFRTIRANLERAWRDRTIHVIMVTSPSPGDGKTTVTALFAEALARLGTQVLLIDADLRRPGIARSFGVSPDKGLSQVLRDSVSLEAAIQTGWVDGLTVIATEPDADAGDLLARRFEAVMAEARRSFDLIVVDTPPLLGTDDARTIATLVDGVLVVVSAGTPASLVSEAVMALEGLEAPVLGAIGNRLRESRSSYYYT